MALTRATQDLPDTLERHALGQWFTPPDVADLALSLAWPGEADEPRILDPACGDGVFLARARARGVAASRLAGIDIDPRAAELARVHAPGAAIVCGDLFETRLEPFDAVVGNPPYVRQERLSAAQKQRIRQVLGRDWPGAEPGDLDRLTGRGDLAAACVLRALSLARPGGRVALVVSSALLHAGYAAALWRTVALAGRVLALVDAPMERWFADAAVNAMILVMERRSPEKGPVAGDDPPVCVARLRVPTSEAARRVRAMDDVASDLASDLAGVADVRLAPCDRPARWAACLRAPAAWFELEQAARDMLVPLGHVAEVRRGVTSGANDVFYVSRQRAAELGLEPEVLVPLLRSPRDAGCIAIDPAKSSHLALLCPADPDALDRHPAARAYIRAHEARASRPTLRSRNPWWALPGRPARLFLTKAYAARFVQRLASEPMVADQRVYAVYPRPDIDVRVLAGILNSTFTILALEALGRSSMGEGALEWTVADAAELPVLDPRKLALESAQDVMAALDALAHRPMLTIDGEEARPDRRRLDLAVAGRVPGMAGILDAIWPALIQTVHSRNHRPARRLG